MHNPFDELIHRLDRLEQLFSAKQIPQSEPIEVINRAELQKRLALSEPTVIAWEKRGKIKSIRIGSAVRYNWPSVVAELENPTTNKGK